MAYTVVTGAAGFVGSNIVKALNARGVHDIIAVDDLKNDSSQTRHCEIADYYKDDFIRMSAGKFEDRRRGAARRRVRTPPSATGDS